MRPTCPRCQLPAAACLCAWVRPVANRLPVLLLQHPQEATQAKGSARLLCLSLAQCTRQVGLVFDAVALGGWLGPPDHSLLLFPAAAGAAGKPPEHGPAPPPRQLVLLDGTWRQARALLRHNPALQALPRWAWPEPAPPRYAIRRAHLPAQRSTLEAACAALASLEGRPAHYAPLLGAFSGWVAALQARSGQAAPPGPPPAGS